MLEHLAYLLEKKLSGEVRATVSRQEFRKLRFLGYLCVLFYAAPLFISYVALFRWVGERFLYYYPGESNIKVILQWTVFALVSLAVPRIDKRIYRWLK